MQKNSFICFAYRFQCIDVFMFIWPLMIKKIAPQENQAFKFLKISWQSKPDSNMEIPP